MEKNYFKVYSSSEDKNQKLYNLDLDKKNTKFCCELGTICYYTMYFMCFLENDFKANGYINKKINVAVE